MPDTSSKTHLVTPQETHTLSGWKSEIFDEFSTRMTSKDNNFPCIFGVEAVTRGTLRYGFISDDQGNQATQVAQILRDFTEICRELGKRTSLVCFFESWQAGNTHAAYWDRFWRMLREVSQFDDAPWPTDISPALDDPKFEFTFNGQPMFVVVNTDLHERRMSRHMSRVTVTFQPRFVFEDIAEGTRRGDAAREVIRGRLATYDDAPLPATLGNFGDGSNREWKQYYLDDGDASEIPASCPFGRF